MALHLNYLVKRVPGRLSFDETLFWKDILYRLIKIGIELEFAPARGTIKKDVMPRLVKALSPTHDLDHFGKLGIYDVVSEHCGYEIQVIGRYLCFFDILNQITRIINIVKNFKLRVRPTCGLHFHFLVPDNLPKPIPSVIGANILNLTIYFAPALKFISSAGASQDVLCRRRNHNSHREIMLHDASETPIWKIVEKIENSTTVDKHQNFLNLEHVRFDENYQMEIFHYEFRYHDMDIIPITIVSKAFLNLALLMKAITISEFGIFRLGDKYTKERRVKLMDRLSNNDGDLATSDTSSLTDEDIKELQAYSRAMIEFFKPELKKFGSLLLLNVLFSLAEKPISLMRAEGYSWDQMYCFFEKMLGIVYEQHYEVEIERKIAEEIALGRIRGTENPSEWVSIVAGLHGIEEKTVKDIVSSLSMFRGLAWDKDLGCYILY